LQKSLFAEESEMLEKLRKTVWEANVALPQNGLVLWTSGNASGRDPETGLVVIKPSGVLFDDLTPENLVVVDVRGNVVEGELKPSVDTASHLYVYRHRADVHGMVHTHSPYATSFAIRGEPLRIYTTTSAAVFGGDIPVSDFATIGEEEIGREIVEKIGRNSAILMRSHGVFTIGKDVLSALKSAVILEETAQAVHYAMLRGPIAPLPGEVVEAGYRVYHTNYGQK
jgi:L-ribulose-5-phosphate 4-epimerase